MIAGSRPTLRLTLACDNACVFCCQTGLESPHEPIDARIRSLRDANHDAVTLVGGEPLLSEDLESVVERLKTEGFQKIGLQTNGGRLAKERELCERLANAGLTDIHISIHGARPEVHDHHTGRIGSFERLDAALGHARAAKLAIVATTVLTRSNQAVVGELPPLLRKMGASAWVIAVPVATGRAEDFSANVLPRLALAIPYALHAMNCAEKAGLSAFIAGAPLCLLGPLADRALKTPELNYASPCSACPARAACPGVDPVYIERFGGDELRPREAPRARTDDPWAPLFVGTGERAPRRKAAASAGSLPVVR